MDPFRRSFMFICLASIALATSAPAQTPQETIPNPTVLTVNGQPVYAGEINLAMQNIAVDMQRRGMQVEQEQLFQTALGQVVDSRLLAQEARRRGLQSSAERVAAILSRGDQQAGGREVLESHLQRVGMSVADFETTVRETDLVQQLVERQLKPGISVSDEDVSSFYKENQARFELPEQVRARHILVKLEADAGDEAKVAARAKIDAARERAVAGEDFAALAKELSDCPSARQGGDLGFFGQQQMVEPFSEAAFALEPGAISEVVETRFGYHVIKLEERRAARTQPVDEAREQIRETLTNQKVMTTVTELLAKLRAEAKIVPVEEGGIAAGDAVER